MNPALQQMLARYPRNSADECVNALREVLQELALLGLWRGRFFERAAFYGGTALRILYGLDRFSEDMDFSLLAPDDSFSLERYLRSVDKELSSWGFRARTEIKEKSTQSAIESAFVKANTREQLLVIETAEEVAGSVHPGRLTRIKMEVDTDPPPGFTTETRFCLQPIPFSVRAYSMPSLFAGKMHALLCRGWGKRVKGRDWYDFVWYVGRDVPLDLGHLDARMRQSGHYGRQRPLTPELVRQMLEERISTLDVAQAKVETARFLPDAASVEVWSRDFFRAVSDRLMVAPSVLVQDT